MSCCSSAATMTIAGPSICGVRGLSRARPLPALADAGHAVVAKEGGHTFEVEETVDAGLKEVFEQLGLDAVCLDVCRELGVTSL